LTEATWKRNALITVEPGSAYSVRAWWTPEWVFGGWYVNLQAPLTRTAQGFHTEDHFLDILVQPDRTWTWKDEDELVLAVQRDRVSAAKADAIRAEGERVVARIEAGAFPFDGSLKGWRPDPVWTVPELRPDWREAT
jgi:predicted RNA-binding protein associated with RNAse of E/G family